MIILPFAPGVPWVLKDDFVVPKLDTEILKRTIEDRKIAIVCYGGFFESFVSLTFAELYNKIYDKKYYWVGDEKFIDLPKLSGLFIVDHATNINKSNLKNYPLPLFIDKDNFAYVNCLFNYINKTSLIYMNKENNQDALFRQIFKNSFTKWRAKYKPVFRKLQPRKEFTKICEVNKFYLSSRYVLIVEKLNWSMHNKSNLGWNRNQIQELASILSLINVKVVVVSNYKMIGHNIISFSPNISDLILLMQKATVILSEEIDFSMASPLISKASLYGRIVKKSKWDLAAQVNSFSNGNISKLNVSVTCAERIKPKEIYDDLRTK